MAKKIIKGIGKIGGGLVGSALFGGKKKKAATPIEGQPIVTPLNQAAVKRDPRKRPQRSTLGGTVLGELSGTLGG